MISHCPHCQQALNLNEAQKAKVQEALTSLPAGKLLKLGCPHCKKPFELNAEGELGGDLMKDLLASEYEYGGSDSDELIERVKAPVKPVKPPPTAPPPPDVDWLQSGEYAEREVVTDVPLALILMPAGEAREAVAAAFEKRSYKSVFFESAEKAIDEMRFTDFAAAVFHSTFEGGLADSVFHDHMKRLGMNKRRYIYYILIGPEFHTLYDLEALAHSANLVVNDSEVAQIDTILKKGMHDYEELFGPYIQALKARGRR